MKRSLKAIWENVEISIGAICIVASLVIGFITVVTRYVFAYTPAWSEEVLRFLCYWMCFGGSAYAFRVGAHVGVEFITGKLGPKAGKAMQIVIKLLTMFYFALIVFYGGQITISKFRMGQVSPAGNIPMWIPLISLPFGGILVLIRLGYDLVKLIRGSTQEGDNVL